MWRCEGKLPSGEALLLSRLALLDEQKFLSILNDVFFMLQ